MELADVVGSVRRHWRLSVAMVLLAGVVLCTFLVTADEVERQQRYEASVQLLVPTRNEDGELPPGVPPFLTQGQETLALSQDVIQAAPPEGEAGAHVTFSATLGEGSDIINLSARAPDPDTARAAADSYSRAFVDARQAQVASRLRSSSTSTRSSVAVLSDRLDEIDAELISQDLPLLAIQDEPQEPEAGEEEAEEGSQPVLDLPDNIPLDTVLLYYERNDIGNRIREARAEFADLSNQALTPRSYVDVLERPRASQVIAEPLSPLIPIGIALAAGLVLAIVVPVLVDRLDRSVKDAKGASEAFSAPVLSAIPAAPRGERVALAAPGSPREDAFRSLTATSVATDRLPKVIMVTSPTGEAHDAVAANFAAALAGLGLKVTLIATASRQAWFAPDTNGSSDGAIVLPDLLERAHAGRLNGEVGHRLATTEVANLMVVPPGEGGKLSLDGMSPLLEALSAEQVDCTVIAGPALLEDANATILAWTTRSVLWVCKTGEVSASEAREAAARLDLAGGAPFGVAMVDRR